MKNKLIYSLILALFSLMINVFYVKYSYINILLYFVFTYTSVHTTDKFWRNWLLVYLPFFVLQTLPLIIHNHINENLFKNLYINNEIYLIVNVLTPVIVFACLIIKYYKFRGLLIVIISVLTIISGFYSWAFQTFFAGSLFLLLSLYIPLKVDDSFLENFWIIYLPIFIVYTLNPIWEPIFSGISFEIIRLYILPINLIIPLSIISGLKIRKVEHKKKLGFIFLSVSILAIIGFIGYPNWNTMINKKDNLKVIPVITIITEMNDTIVIKNIENIIVLSVWSSACSICYKEFPEYQKLVKFYKNNSQVKFYSVNVPLKRDDRNKITAQIKLTYDFPIYFADDSFAKDFKIQSYPQMIVIKNNKNRYFGLPEFRKTNYFNCYKLIDNILVEKLDK